jgi:hypothetical protein
MYEQRIVKYPPVISLILIWSTTLAKTSLFIPVIASCGAGKVEHFSEVFGKTDVETALVAGIFHREEVPIEAVKKHIRDERIEMREVVTLSVHRNRSFLMT